MNILKKFSLYFVCLACWGWICGGMDNVALSYIVGALGGLGIFYLFYRKDLK